MEISNFNQHIITLASKLPRLPSRQPPPATASRDCARRHKLWVIVMAAVDFIDSSGICALVGGLNAARHRGCRLVICNLSATVRLIFEITQLDQLFEIFDSFDQIISAETPPLVA